MKDAEAVTFAGGLLDRRSGLRGDAVAMAALANSPAARCLALLRGRPLLTGAPGAARLAWIACGHAVFAGAAEPIFLGEDPDGVPHFAREIADPGGAGEAWSFAGAEREGHSLLPADLGFADLRAVMAELHPGEAAVAATAKGILAWHTSHRFCAACGAASAMAEAGWHRVCPACGTRHFPRTDPVVIMLVTHGNAVLMGRQSSWPPGMFSLLAGFMEPGETIEAAVRRETYEETAVRVGRVDYLASQPWPFPANLMIGCHGHALSTDITIDPSELEAARWVSREAMMRMQAGEDPEMRPSRRGSIARFLIERWLADRLD